MKYNVLEMDEGRGRGYEEEVVMEGREAGGETLFNTYDTTTLSQVNAPKLFFVPPNC